MTCVCAGVTSPSRVSMVLIRTVFLEWISEERGCVNCSGLVSETSTVTIRLNHMMLFTRVKSHFNVFILFHYNNSCDVMNSVLIMYYVRISFKSKALFISSYLRFITIKQGPIRCHGCYMIRYKCF